MLRELNTKQNAGDFFRRWFNDEFFDLFAWYDDGPPVGFQLCYDKDGRESALTYLDGLGYTLNAVDSGEDSVWGGAAPVLKETAEFPRGRILDAFSTRSSGIDAEVRYYVLGKLEAYAEPVALSTTATAVASRPCNGEAEGGAVSYSAHEVAISSYLVDGNCACDIH